MSELYGASETSVVKIIAGSEAVVFNNQARLAEAKSSEWNKKFFRILPENYLTRLIMASKRFTG